MKIYRDKNEGKSQCQYEKKNENCKNRFYMHVPINYINTEMNEKFNKAFILII